MARRARVCVCVRIIHLLMRETVVCVRAGLCRCARAACVRATGAARVLFFHRFFFVFVHRSGPPSPPPPLTIVATRPPLSVCINVPQSVTLVHSHTRKHPSRHYVPHSAIPNRRRPPPTTTLQLNHRGPRAPPLKRQSRTRPPPTTRPSESKHTHPSFTVVSRSVIIILLLLLFIITIILLYTSTVLHILLLSYVRDVVCTVYCVGIILLLYSILNTRSPVYR